VTFIFIHLFALSISVLNSLQQNSFSEAVSAAAVLIGKLAAAD